MSESMLFKPDGWTIDDLPDDEGRYEIVDGALVVSPPATPRHDAVKNRLARLLADRIDPDRILVEAGVSWSTRNYRVPDVKVVREGFDVWESAPAPADIVLLVEVVSPSSVTTDHVTKRAQYAAQGIGAYWIVETDPEVTVTALALPAGGDVYVEVGRWAEGDSITVQEPFPISFEVAALRRG